MAANVAVRGLSNDVPLARNSTKVPVPRSPECLEKWSRVTLEAAVAELASEMRILTRKLHSVGETAKVLGDTLLA